MSRKSTGKILLFLVAFLVACALWNMVVAYSESKISISLGDIEVNTTGLEQVHRNGYAAYITGDTKVGVTVTVLQEKGWLVNSSNIRLKADLSEAHLGHDESVVYIKPEVIGNQSVIGSNYKLETNYITVKTEKLIEKQIPVLIETQGIVEDGYTSGSGSADTPVITVKVPQSLENESLRVVAAVDINGLKSDFTGSCLLTFYDKEGGEIDCDALQIIPEKKSIEVAVPIGIEKELNISLPDKSRLLMEGRRCTSITADKEKVSVLVKNPEEAIGNSVIIPASALESENYPDDYSVFLHISDLLPESVEVANKSDDLLMVTVSSKAVVKKELRVNADQISTIGLASGYNSEVVNASCKVSLLIPSELENQITEEEILLKVNLSGLAAGLHKLTPEVSIRNQSIDPQSIEVLSADKISVRLTASE